MTYRPIQDVHNSITLHPPSTDVVGERMDHIRENAHAMIDQLYANVPEGRELSIALTHLEDMVMWAIKGIALHQ